MTQTDLADSVAPQTTTIPARPWTPPTLSSLSHSKTSSKSTPGAEQTGGRTTTGTS